MSDLTPDLQEMAARPNAAEMPMPHEIRRAGERRRRRLAVVTAACVAAVVTVATGLVVWVVPRDAASVEPADQRSPSGAQTIHAHVAPTLHRPGRTGDLPPGTYQFAVTAAELRASGMTEFDPILAGTWTWKLGDGRWSYQETPSKGLAPGSSHGIRCAGYYDVVGDHIDFTKVVGSSLTCSGPTFEATWSRVPGGLRMHNVLGFQPDYLVGGERWERISN